MAETASAPPHAQASASAVSRNYPMNHPTTETFSETPIMEIDLTKSTPFEAGRAALALAFAGGATSVTNLVGQQLRLVASNRLAPTVERVDVERDGDGLVSGATKRTELPFETSLNELSGMLSALLDYAFTGRIEAGQPQEEN
jgi:hypothetical protein